MTHTDSICEVKMEMSIKEAKKKAEKLKSKIF